MRSSRPTKRHPSLNRGCRAAVEPPKLKPSADEAAEEEKASSRRPIRLLTRKPTNGSSRAEAEPEATSDQAAPAEEAGGRLSRMVAQPRSR